MTAQTKNPVVFVGVDGSPSSKDALRWAVHYAELSGATVHALIAWQLPEIYAYMPRDFEGEARQTLVNAIDDVLGAGAHNKLTLHVVEGHPAEELVKMCHDAQLLVVGSHGHGAFAGMLLGSVSLHCVQHACCPVVVVRNA